MTTKRPDASEYPPRYQRYMLLVDESNVLEAMARQEETTKSFLLQIPDALHGYRYAPGKWTVREVVGHILDTERIFGFRLLCFARGDTASLRSADEVLYVNNAEFARYTLAALVEEFLLV